MAQLQLDTCIYAFGVEAKSAGSTTVKVPRCQTVHVTPAAYGKSEVAPQAVKHADLQHS